MSVDRWKIKHCPEASNQARFKLTKEARIDSFQPNSLAVARPYLRG